ncbi:MAG: PIN domain-containing protein [Polyangiaceae bacterium]|nr:PIN domain-containing protein [Polyangiaceae bacterium]
MVGRDLVRHLAAVVAMELRVGASTLPARRALDKLLRAYRASSRVVVPSAALYDEAGRVLRKLRESGREIRHAALVNDVLIALCARSVGATLYTRDEDHRVIRDVVGNGLEVVPAATPS